MRSIDRIVLYIDDLDRCPPERVVEVMQAVHLLLAFRLFVVVVAVDSRWMMRSLEKVYPDFLALDGRSEDDDDAGDDRSAARRSAGATTPHNYLEKIFQVSFSVRPIEQTGFLGLLNRLARRPSIGAGSHRSTASPDDSPTDPGDGDTGGASTPVGHDPTGLQDAAAMQAPEPPAMNPPTLEISDDEWSFMSELHGLFRTPRSVKRFVNTYRIVKVTYADEVADLAAQRIAQALLAALVAKPGDAARLFAEIHEGPDAGTLSSLTSRLARTLCAHPRLQTLTLGEVRPWLPRIARFATRPIELGRARTPVVPERSAPSPRTP